MNDFLTYCNLPSYHNQYIIQDMDAFKAFTMDFNAFQGISDVQSSENFPTTVVFFQFTPLFTPIYIKYWIMTLVSLSFC